MPFYKWAYHGIGSLSLLQNTGRRLSALTGVNALLEQEQYQKAYEEAFNVTEQICEDIAKELNRQGLSSVHSSFLQDHLPSIMEGICDPQLRSMNYLADCAN